MRVLPQNKHPCKYQYSTINFYVTTVYTILYSCSFKMSKDFMFFYIVVETAVIYGFILTRQLRSRCPFQPGMRIKCSWISLKGCFKRSYRYNVHWNWSRNSRDIRGAYFAVKLAFAGLENRREHTKRSNRIDICD